MKVSSVPYVIEELGDRSTFNVHPKPHYKNYLGLGMLSMPVDALVSWYLSTEITGSSNASGVTIVLFIILYPFIFWFLSVMERRSYNKSRKVVDEPFTISPSGIEIGGASIATGQIHRVVLRNALDGDLNIIHGGSGMAAAASVSAAQNANKNVKRAFYVAAEHGGTQTVLAGGMDEPQANAVFMEVTRRLGLD